MNSSLKRGVIEFEVDQTQLQILEIKLKQMSDKAPRALKNAVNATARDAKKALANKAQETYVIKTTKFRNKIKQKNATIAYPTATLRVTGKKNKLEDFQTRRNSAKESAKAKVLKSNSLKAMISRKTGNKAFMSGVTTGHTGKTHVGVFQREGKSRLPIKSFYGPSDPQMVGSERRVYGVIRREIEEELQKNIQKQIDKIMGGK